MVERLITTAMAGDLRGAPAARGISSPSRPSSRSSCEQIAPALKGRTGGYTRITKTRVRPGDAAELSLVEIVT